MIQHTYTKMEARNESILVEVVYMLCKQLFQTHIINMSEKHTFFHTLKFLIRRHIYITLFEVTIQSGRREM